MKYVIAILLILTISFFMGLVLGAVASEADPLEQQMEDHDQEEYLRRWKEGRRRS